MGKVAIITGASSGIGEALARELAKRGYDLGLIARRRQRLEELARQLRAGGTQVAVADHDVAVTDATGDVLAALANQLGGLDVLIVNAGVGGSGQVGAGQFEQARKVIEVNLIGAMATIDAAVELMKSGGGQIVGITSVAGYRGMPGSAAYSASKAGLATYLEAVRGEVHRHGIVVTDIAPGYIDTPINQHVEKRPFLITADQGAVKIANAIERGRMHATVPGWPWATIGWVMRNVPDRLWLRATG
ncbi:MAG: SDR family NAD(P)-dependent oxidoreductase, partial [Deltaproteobacteria bacterium]|nr:SDR family NAD(P)-dependent oxidoreductase [Deltaproteobacteria bacterium]